MPGDEGERPRAVPHPALVVLFQYPGLIVRVGGTTTRSVAAVDSRAGFHHTVRGLHVSVIKMMMMIGRFGLILRVVPPQVTKESDPELFHVLPWSHGTLGFLVGIEVTPPRPSTLSCSTSRSVEVTRKGGSERASERARERESEATKHRQWLRESGGRAVCQRLESDPELFHILPWSHGTLGFLVAIEVVIF